MAWWLNSSKKTSPTVFTVSENLQHQLLSLIRIIFQTFHLCKYQTLRNRRACAANYQDLKQQNKTKKPNPQTI
jgi:hypothetical protein